jgi:hypothetical protein
MTELNNLLDKVVHCEEDEEDFARENQVVVPV